MHALKSNKRESIVSGNFPDLLPAIKAQIGRLKIKIPNEMETHTACKPLSYDLIPELWRGDYEPATPPGILPEYLVLLFYTI